MTSETQSENLKLAGLLAAGALLEALYLRMHSLYYLKNHAIAFMVLALAAGIVYLIALYGFDQTRASRATFILLIFAALVFRATLWPMQPTLSDDLQRYRWDAKVQANGWNPYAIAPQDPRLTHLRDHEYEIMPGRETPTIYPPATELLYHATWKMFPGPTAFKAPFAAADVLVMLLLAWIFREDKDRAFRVAVYAWNPLVIVEFAGSGHNDVLALLGMVAGLALVKRSSALAGKTRRLVGGRACGRVVRACDSALLAGAGCVSRRPGILRGAMEKLPCELVYTDRLADRRRNPNPRVSRSRGDLGACHLARVETHGARSRGLLVDRNQPRILAQRLSVVFHVDRSAALFFSESRVAVAHCAAIFVLQRPCRLRHPRPVQI